MTSIRETHDVGGATNTGTVNNVNGTTKVDTTVTAPARDGSSTAAVAPPSAAKFKDPNAAAADGTFLDVAVAAEGPSASDEPNAKASASVACTITVAHTAATADLGTWVADLLTTRLADTPGGLAVRSVAAQTEAEFLTSITTSVGDNPSAPNIVIVTFFDGTAPEAKAVFQPIKAWAAACAHPVVLQALNAKKGQHSLMSNADAVVSSVAKKLPSSAASTAAPADAKKAEAEKTAGESELVPGKVQEEVGVDFNDLSDIHLERRLTLGQGECTWLLKAASHDALAAKLAELSAAAATVSSKVFPLLPAPLPEDIAPEEIGAALAALHKDPSAIVPWAARPVPSDKDAVAAEFVVRRTASTSHAEMRLAMCGNVDSGKSTLTSVLTHGVKDDGRGLARARVFNHRHEAETGRTSSVSENHLGYDANGHVVNYPLGGFAASVAAKASHGVTATELAAKSSKIVTLYDLAGHEKYLKTTVLGMTRTMPDYACIVISANNGIQRMTKEHLGLCLALKLPFFVVITRIDATPPNVMKETVQSVYKLLKAPTVKKLPFPVKTGDDVVVCAKNLRMDRITPVFEVSNVTGQGIHHLSSFINIVPLRKDWVALQQAPQEMVIDSTFFVTGVGTVVGGVIMSGTFKQHDTVQIGPDGLGHFRSVQIKSIHCKGVEVPYVQCGCDAALCLKKERRNAIRKGNVLISPLLKPKAYWQFEAEVRVLYHSTTIAANYEPVIHSPTVRQSARIVEIDREVLRTGDHALVRFQFLYRPEYMHLEQRLIFREGRTKGIGRVTSLIEAPQADLPPLGGQAHQAAKDVRAKERAVPRMRPTTEKK